MTIRLKDESSTPNHVVYTYDLYKRWYPNKLIVLGNNLVNREGTRMMWFVFI